MRKQEQLLARLQSLVHTESSDQHAVVEVLSYFLKRLASQQTASRQLAVKVQSFLVSMCPLDILLHLDWNSSQRVILYSNVNFGNNVMSVLMSTKIDILLSVEMISAG